MEHPGPLDKENRDECARILTMTESECAQLFSDMLWSDGDICLVLLNTLHNNVKSPLEAAEILAHAKSCVTVVADLDCNGKTDYREYDLVVFPFTNKKTWIRVHQMKMQFRQCVQMLLKNRTFTIHKMYLYGLGMEWKSFSRHVILNRTLDRNRVRLLGMYSDLVVNSYAKSYTRQEIRQFLSKVESLTGQLTAEQYEGQ